MIILLRLLILIALLLLTMFFTASETALTNLRRSQIKRLIREKGAKGLSLWLNDPNRLLATTLSGTAVSVVALSVVGTTTALDLAWNFGFPQALAAAMSTVIIVAAVLVFAEIVPKAYARRNPQKISCLIIGPLRIIDFIFAPVVKIFTVPANIFIKIFGGKPLKDQPLFEFEEVKGLIQMGVKEGVIADAEEKMLSQIMEFGNTVVREVMVPRVDVKFLDIDRPSGELIEQAINLRHSRIPVYRDNLDTIIGILYVKDLLPVLAKKQEPDIEKVLRRPYFVPETKRIRDLLMEFRQGREHAAIAVDEYGVPAGLVTIEDIVEEITGEIFDEYDIRKKRIVRLDENTWEISAVEDLDKINDELGLDLPEDAYDSLGGLIVGELGKVPDVGEGFRYRKYKFEILKATPTRVISVQLKTG
jgi:CBS domain containing-hemolysin-like protein